MRQPLLHLPFGYAQHAPDLGKRGPEILVDHDMEASGMTDWTVTGTAVKVAGGRPGSTGTQVMRVSDIASVNGIAKQNVLTTGKVYEITGYARGDGAGGLPRFINDGLAFWVGTDSTEWQKVREIIVAANIDFRVAQYTDDAYAEYDDISIREVILNDYDMEQVDATAWAEINGATASKQAGVAPDGGGTQLLRVSNSGGAYGGARQNSILTIATEYHIEGWARGDGTVAPVVGDQSDVDRYWTGEVDTAWQYYNFVFTASNVDLMFSRKAGGTDNYVEFAWVKIREVNPRSLNTGKGGDALDAQLGDGSTSTTFPTKLPQCDGYEFDGGDYMVCSAGYTNKRDVVTFKATGMLTNEALSEALVGWETFSGDVVGLLFFVGSLTQMRFYAGTITSTGAASVNLDGEVGDGRLFTLYGWHNGTDTFLVVNGRKMESASVPVALPQTNNPITMGARSNGTTSPYSGKLFDVQVEQVSGSYAEAVQYHREQMAKGYI